MENKINKNIFNLEQECFIIAEVSSNHNQDINIALESIAAAKEAGASAVKFQVYEPETLTIDCQNDCFMINHPQWGGMSLYDLYQKAYTPLEWIPILKKAADKLGIIFFATAFDKKGVDLLESIDVPFHKVSSFELIDLSLIEYIAKTGKPIILSTGMATLEEIEEAIGVVRSIGDNEVVLLKCVSSYPAEPKEMNLKTIQDMAKKFNCVVGLSDHSLGTAISVASVAMGAKMIEKHFILSKEIETPDSFFSIDSQELKQLVKDVRTTEKAIGKVHYGMTKAEEKNQIFRRSLFVVKDIKKGEVFTEENVRSIRPSSGLEPKCLKQILGRVALRDISRGTPLQKRDAGL